MCNFEIIKIEDMRWDRYIKSANIFDFYHTSCYHKMEQNKGESPILFIAHSGQEFLCLPLIIKEIKDTDFFDATSVYGYCGPVSSKPFDELNEKLTDFFKSNFLKYCNANKIISVFSRLHPLVKTEGFYQNFGSVKKLNKVVTIDLSEPIGIQRQHYSRSYKNKINTLKKKKGYSVSTLDKNNISVFKDIYFETMRRLDAKDYYFFSDEYLKRLIENECFQSEILIAYNKEGMPASAAVFTMTKGIMQYHLGGTKDFALNDSPIKYVMDEARLLANEREFNYFNLGGGVGGSDDDSLFRFKSGFSKNFHQFSVWNLVVNQEVYDKLVQDKGMNKENHPNFFPLYRANK